MESATIPLIVILLMCAIVFKIFWKKDKSGKWKFIPESDAIPSKHYANTDENINKCINESNDTERKHPLTINEIASLIISIIGFMASVSSLLMSAIPFVSALLASLISINALMILPFMSLASLTCVPVAGVAIFFSCVSLFLKRNKLAIIAISISVFSAVFSLALGGILISLLRH